MKKILLTTSILSLFLTLTACGLSETQQRLYDKCMVNKADAVTRIYNEQKETYNLSEVETKEDMCEQIAYYVPEKVFTQSLNNGSNK